MSARCSARQGGSCNRCFASSALRCAILCQTRPGHTCSADAGCKTRAASTPGALRLLCARYVPCHKAHHPLLCMSFAAPRFLAREPKAGLRAAALGFATFPFYDNLHHTPLVLSKCSSPLHADKQWAKGQTAIKAHASQDDLVPSKRNTCSRRSIQKAPIHSTLELHIFFQRSFLSQTITA